ncbi:MAG: hypothetical protein GY720_20165 [bacterium]|nr:hypothetical protein [bacterium]
MTDRTDDGDQGSSSDDLIRQARAEYEPTEYGNVPPAQPPASRSETPSSDSPPISRPSDYVRSEYQDQPVGGGAVAPTYQAETPSFFSRYGRLLLFGVVILGFIAYSLFDKTKAVDDLAVGDCLLMPAEEEITDVETADCEGEHQLEVFAIVTLTATNGSPYPGDDEVAGGIFDLCMPRFEPYVGATFEDSIWWVNAIYPSPESWEEENDRKGKCVVFQPGAGDDVIMLSGSARGSNQ